MVACLAWNQEIESSILSIPTNTIKYELHGAVAQLGRAIG